MEDSKEKIGLLLDSGYQSDSTPVSESPVPDEKTSAGSKYEASEAKDEKDRFYTVNVGAWTVYYAIASAWTNPLPGLKFIQRGRDIILGLPVVWKFLLENLSLGPVLFLTYFLSTMLSGLISSAKLYNSMKILEMIEKPEANQDINRQNFYRIVFGYLLAFLADWVVRKIGARGEPILRQRVNLYFRTKILAAHSRLDYATFHDPVIQTKLRRAEGYSSSAWAILESVSTMISMAAEVATQTSVMIQVLSAREDSLTFFIVCLAKSLVSQFAYSFTGAAYYTQITDPRWMRMDALYDMGTQDHFKQDVLGDNLEEYINTEYKKNREEFGDTRSDQPEIQWESKSLLSLTDLDAVLDVIPTIAFAWSAVQGTNASRLSSLILIQQATTSLHATASRIWYSGGDLASVITNIISLCDVIETKPKVPDGEIAYPEHADQTGMSIEFKCVGFSYPGQDRHILKDMSFCIGAGQLCVIVGENGCGKSTTISLISRLYDCTSGEILIDGRPLTDFKISTVRDATCVMYQNYSHYPLPVGENIRIGRYSEGSQEDVETAAKLAGAYDFIQKLPEKFDTDLACNSSGYGSHWYQDDERNPFQNLIDAQHKTQVSGGEWRRLALAKTYMRNSDRIKLLCYDEPSASLDPKAESKAFEQIRSLQGQKTMIFITHRFGHLTKHADIILYMQGGAIIEKGTHQELMALDGEYAKMYNIQSRAFI